MSLLKIDFLIIPIICFALIILGIVIVATFDWPGQFVGWAIMGGAILGLIASLCKY